MHWANQYIGKPWVAGARGPEAFDCWGLVLYVQREHFNRELPTIPVDADNLNALARTFGRHPERKRWKEEKRPHEGDAVLLRQARYPIHVGIWLDVDGGGILHCVKGMGVVFQKERDLINGGWRIEGYYRFVGE